MAQKKKAARKKSKPTAHPLKKASRLFLPYPLFVFLMLSVGVLLLSWTFNISAEDLKVRVKVPAPALTEPAVIESPADGTRFKEVPIKVTGSCPLDSYVNIYRNNVFSGSALCSADKTFEISTDLFEGANELQVKAFNITDDEGPQSDPITVYYDAPKPPVEPAPGTVSPPPASQPSVPPLLIKSDFKYKGYFTGQLVRWPLEINGGSPPYAINVEWGDGETSLISLKEAGKFNIEHIYDKAGAEKGNYEVKISATDSAGRKTYFQFFIMVRDENAPVAPGGTTGDSAGIADKREWLKFIWPAYGIVVLMAVSFWLGEREELIELRRHAARRRRHT